MTDTADPGRAEMTAPATYDVHALRYFTRDARREHEFFRNELYGDASSGPLSMDYSFWLVRGNDRTVLVDCGFDAERAAVKNRFQDTDPVDLLARMDVRVEDVDHVVITHMHYDHVGNVALFPNATFSMAREEFDFWRGPYGDRQLMQVIVDPAEVALVQSLHDEGRLELIDGSAEVVPGVTATRVGGHTPGQLIVSVPGRSSEVVLASDAMHYYEEIDLDRPYNLFTDLGGLYAGYDTLRSRESEEGTTVVAGHDPLVAEVFREVAQDCFDLSDQIRER